MKPHRYELNLRATEQDAALLRAYLRQNCIPGEQVELWSLWWVMPGFGPSAWRDHWRIWTPMP